MQFINIKNYIIMARRGGRLSKSTLFSSSGYSGGRKAASTSSGGSLGRKSKFVSRRQRYGDLRKAFGLSGG